jgi:predicted nucleic acid-binding protein
MYLIDTDVISEARKEGKANAGVRQFFADADRNNVPIYLSVVTIGEMRRVLRSLGIAVKNRKLVCSSAGSSA